MNPSPLLRARVICFAFMPCLLLPCLTGASAWAQDKTAAAAASAPAKTRPTAPALFSLDLKATPLRQALVSLFTNANAQYSIGEDVPNTPVTLTLRDKTVYNALLLLLQEVKGVTYTVEGGVIQVKTAPAVAEPLRTESILLQYLRPSDVTGRLQTVFPTSLVIPGTDAASLLVRGTAQQNQDVRELANFLDVAPRTVVLRAEVVLSTGSTSSGKIAAIKGTWTKTPKPPTNSSLQSTLLSTTLRTLSGQEATGDDKLVGTPAQSAKLQLNATPVLFPNGSLQVDTRWDVSLPLPTGTTNPNGAKSVGIVRLEKRLTTTTRLGDGETALVGSVLLNQYGLKGEILFFVTATVVY